MYEGILDFKLLSYFFHYDFKFIIYKMLSYDYLTEIFPIRTLEDFTI